jgi:hypothetical protein
MRPTIHQQYLIIERPSLKYSADKLFNVRQVEPGFEFSWGSGFDYQSDGVAPIDVSSPLVRWSGMVGGAPWGVGVVCPSEPFGTAPEKFAGSGTRSVAWSRQRPAPVAGNFYPPHSLPLAAWEQKRAVLAGIPRLERG